MRRLRNGFTLVELLVASSILTIVLTIVTSFFVSQSRASAMQKATNEATEAARIALSLLSWDIQNAGYRVMVSESPADFLGIRASEGGAADSLVIRYLDESLASPQPQRISYSLGGEPRSLRRAQYDDSSASAPTDQPTVATVVALNLRYETRPNQYRDLVGGSCPAGTTPIGSPVENCLVPWAEQDVAQRLVRQVRVELLARSATRVPGYQDRRASYDFSDGSSYVPESGYVYRYAEQTVLAPNLGR